MNTRRQRCIKTATSELLPNVLIKQELEWLVEDSHAPDLANREEELDIESTRSVKTEEDPYHTHAEAHAVQEFTPLPQTDEFIKAELILDEEFRDKMSDSKENCKQLALPLADDQKAKVGKSDKEVCGSSLTHKANLDIQMHNKHWDKAHSITPLECDFRSRTLERKDSFHGEDGKKVFPCEVCERNFSSMSNLKSHKDVHTRKLFADFKTFICEVCKSRFTAKASLKRHMLRKHLDKAQSNLPGPQTADDVSVDSDMEEFLDEEPACNAQASPENTAQYNEIKADKKSEACEVCHCTDAKEYMRTHKHLEHSRKRKDSFRTHLSNHAEDGKQEFLCDLCERTYSSISNLNRHKDVHTRKLFADFKTFICEVCNSRFTEKGSLKRHMLRKHLDKAQSSTPSPQTADDDSIDSDMEEFLDEDAPCNGQAKQKSVAQDSKNKSDLKNQACEVCHCIYPTKLMRMHMRYAHSKSKHECKFCSRTFKRKFTLQKHLNIHERKFYHKIDSGRHMNVGHPVFICHACGSSFTRKVDRDVHVATKHLDKPQPNTTASQTVDHNSIKTKKILENTRTEEPTFECAVCSRSFQTKSILKAHFSTHSEDSMRDFAWFHNNHESSNPSTETHASTFK